MDSDLEDFKKQYGCVKQQEAKYYELMNGLVDRYSDLNYSIGLLFEEVEKLEEKLEKK